MQKLGIIIYSILCFALISCIDQIDILVPDAKSKLVLVSEISPDNRIEVDLSTSVTVNSGHAIMRPVDAEIIISGTGLENSSVGFNYHASENKYILRKSSFRPVEGGNYEIRAHVPGVDYDPVIATTHIPKEITVKNVTLNHSYSSESGALGISYYDLSMQFEEPKERPAFVFVKAGYEVQYFELDNKGDKVITGRGEYENFQIAEVITGKNAIEEPFHMNGILIELAKTSENLVRFVLSTHSELDHTTELIDEIHFQIRSISEEYYQYHMTLSKQLESNAAPFSSPVINYTNIEGGLGLFGGYISSEETFPIQ